MRIDADPRARQAEVSDRPRGAPQPGHGEHVDAAQHSLFARVLRQALQRGTPAGTDGARRRVAQQVHDRAGNAARDAQRRDSDGEQDAAALAPLHALAASQETGVRGGLAPLPWPAAVVSRNPIVDVVPRTNGALPAASRSRARAPASASATLPPAVDDRAVADAPTRIDFGGAARQPSLQLELRRSADGWSLHLGSGSTDLGPLRAALARLRERFAHLALGRLDVFVQGQPAGRDGAASGPTPEGDVAAAAHHPSCDSA